MSLPSARRVLVISPHPDDESIGCGGTLRKHVMLGDRVHAVFLTSGEQGGHGRPLAETARLRECEAEAAASILGLESIEFWREPDGKLRACRELVGRACRTIEVWRPDVLYVTHEREMHPDHRAAARLVHRALSRPPLAELTLDILTYEVWTPMQAMALVVDISPYIDAKLAAVRAHKSQCAAMRFDDAAMALSRYHGEMHCWPGGDFAEVFGTLPVARVPAAPAGGNQ